LTANLYKENNIDFKKSYEKVKIKILCLTDRLKAIKLESEIRRENIIQQVDDLNFKCTPKI
jgi:hypothetical protein